MTEIDRHAVPLDANLSRSQDRQVGLRWPVAVDDKADRLLDLVVDAGYKTSRKEILAALVVACDLDGESLGELILRYRRMKVRDVFPGQADDTTIVHLADHRPGPRTAGAGDKP